LFDSKGLWFVPAVYAEKVRSWKAFLTEIGSGPVILPQFDAVETIQALRAASMESLEGRLLAMKEKMAAMSERSGSTREATWERRLEEFDELRATVELHAQALGIEQADLLSRLKKAEEGVRAAMVEAFRIAS
jgi:hypothetical protein